jgi:flagellar motor switch protein FliN/FliY
MTTDAELSRTLHGGSSQTPADPEATAAADLGPASGNLDLILDVELTVTVELGRTRKRIQEVISLAPGSVLELDRLAGEAVDVLVNGKAVARGEVVVIGENFGVRITEIIGASQRLRTALGGK